MTSSCQAGLRCSSEKWKGKRRERERQRGKEKKEKEKEDSSLYWVKIRICLFFSPYLLCLFQAGLRKINLNLSRY